MTMQIRLQVFIRVWRLNEEEESKNAQPTVKRSNDELLAIASNQEMRNRGTALFFQQLVGMLTKKCIYSLRSWVLFLSQILVPVAFVIITLLIWKNAPGKITLMLHCNIEN